MKAYRFDRQKRELASIVLAGAVTVSSLTWFSGCSRDMDSSFVQNSDGGSTAQSFYSPGPDEVVVDEEDGLQVLKNVMNLTFSRTMDEAAVKKIVASVNGEIVGFDRAVNFYQVKLPGADLATLDKVRLKLLADYKELEMATKCPISVHKNPYYVK